MKNSDLAACEPLLATSPRAISFPHTLRSHFRLYHAITWREYTTAVARYWCTTFRREALFPNHSRHFSVLRFTTIKLSHFICSSHFYRRFSKCCLDLCGLGVDIPDVPRTKRNLPFKERRVVAIESHHDFDYLVPILHKNHGRREILWRQSLVCVRRTPARAVPAAYAC